MAYKSLIDYYGGGMVKPSKGYALGGLIAGAGRQREYSGELRGLQQLAEQAAKRREKLLGGGGWKDKLKSFALGTAATAIAGPAGGAVYKALEQAKREKGFKKTDFSGGKYAQDIREDFGERESALKKQGLSRIGLAGIAGYAGGKASGAFGKAVSGIKGGIGQVKDIAGFLKEGGTMGDVLGGYAQKIGESGVFGDTGISRGLLGMGAKAGIAPTVTKRATELATPSASMENLLTAREGRYKIPGSSYSPHTQRAESAEGLDITGGEEWAVPGSEYARSVLTPTIGHGDLAETYASEMEPEIEEVEKMPFGSTLREIWGSQTDEEKAQEAARYQPWESPAAPSPSLAYQGQGPSSSLMGPAPQQQPVPSMAGSLMPDMPPAGFSGQDILGGEAGGDEFEPFTIPSLLGGDFPGYQPDLGSYSEFASTWMPAGLQTAGGIGYNRQEGGLVDYMMPQGYQGGGQVGYGTATDPLQALEQMGMGDVADDPKLEKYMEDLPQFTMGYKQQLGDVTAGGRAGLMDISQQARTQQAGTGFAGGGAGAVGQAQARKSLERGVATGRRGVVEGYQADLLSALADIEAKGGFEFGGSDSNTPLTGEDLAAHEAGIGGGVHTPEGIPEGWPSRQAFDNWTQAGANPDNATMYGWQAP